MVLGASGSRNCGPHLFLRFSRNAFGCLVADAMRWTYREQGLLCFGVIDF